MKGVWITTVYNQDWPSSSSKGNVEIQKSEFINILEDVMSLGIDTIVVQIRPKSDALYKSSIKSVFLIINIHFAFVLVKNLFSLICSFLSKALLS